MTFAVTSRGFVKTTVRTLIDNRMSVEVIYTDKLREAKQFSARSKAMKFLQAHSLEGFAYNPHEQENIPDRYKVAQKEYFAFDEKPMINEWIAAKVHSLYVTDVIFLTNKTLFAFEHYSLEEARAIALDRNYKMLDELQKKINKSLGPERVAYQNNVQEFINKSEQ